jgi:hypothetical protein
LSSFAETRTAPEMNDVADDPEIGAETLTEQSLRPGTVYADPYGHVMMIVQSRADHIGGGPKQRTGRMSSSAT